MMAEAIGRHYVAYSLLFWFRETAGTSRSLIHPVHHSAQVALGRYQAGVATIIDVLTAQSAAAPARQTRISAEVGWQMARAQLALVIGRLTGAEPLSSVVTMRYGNAFGCRDVYSAVAGWLDCD